MPSRSRSPDEGEIVEQFSDKATTTPYHVSGTKIDRQNRDSLHVNAFDGTDYDRSSVRQKGHRAANHSRSPNRTHQRSQTASRTPSPRNARRSRSRSPYRAQKASLRSSNSRSRSPRGAKRRRHDDHYAPRNRHNDHRGFRGRHEGASEQKHQREGGRRRSAERRNAAGRRDGSWSRSPPRFGDRRNGRVSETRGSPDGSNGRHQASLNNNGSSQTKSNTGTNLTQNRERDGSLDSAPKSNRSVHWAIPDDRAVDDPNSSIYVGDKEPEPQIDEAILIEERRKRREAIKAKHRTQASPMMMQALNAQSPRTPLESSSETPVADTPSGSKVSSAQVSRDTSRQASPASFELSKDADMVTNSVTAGDEPSAADYDPRADMAVDAERANQANGDVSAVGYNEMANDEKDILVPTSQPQTIIEGEFDMFAEGSDEDMFGAPASAMQGTQAIPVPSGKALDLSMLDDVDDVEGYYKIILGELLDSRYAVQANLGKGMFSAVVRALDQTTQKLVAIKIIRANETMRKAAAKELEILGNLNGADAEDRKHVVRLYRSFEHKGHLCMVFESLSINLREVLKKFGRDVGIHLHAVRAYAHQMFLALSLLKKGNVLHADLKPDNILVDEGRTSLKVCDLGSASDAGDNEITPYLVSRFYRAPEIILGMPFDFAIDMWSVGCTLFELYTGKILFTGRSNNQMLKSIMECRGRIPTRVLKKAQLAALHFEQDGSFRSQEREAATGREIVRVLPLVKPTRDLRQRVLAAAGGKETKGGDEARELNLFIDLLDKCLALAPDRRISPADALKHPFLVRGEAKPKSTR